MRRLLEGFGSKRGKAKASGISAREISKKVAWAAKELSRATGALALQLQNEPVISPSTDETLILPEEGEGIHGEDI